MKEKMFSISRTLVPLCALIVTCLASTSIGESPLETGCDPATELACRTNSSLCVPLENVGDGYIDCPDGSDEDCPIGWYVCKDLSGCIAPELLQDGVPDCFDESDEECDEWQHECLCGFPRCIDLSLVSDGSLDCLEGSDELSIDKSTYICPSEVVEEQQVRRRRRHAQAVFSIPIQGTFTEISGGQNAKLEVSLQGALNPKSLANEVVTLIGTQGQFIKDGPSQPTTYDVFTGSYIKDQRSYLFFFGNTALPVASEIEGAVHATKSLPKEVVLKTGGDQSKIFVDMEKNLHVTVPSKTHNIDSTIAPDLLMGEGVINGHLMGGVFIEGSEGFEMEGAQEQSGETSMLTITIGRPVAHTSVVHASSVVDPVEVTVLSMEEKLHENSESDNEIDESILRARKARLTGQEIIADLRPSHAQKIDLPTFTINQVNEPLEKVVEISKNVEKSVETSVSEKRQEQREREGKSFDDIRARFNLESGGADSDLPTVTYVGFADFTTTIADTVVVFTPRSGSPKKALRPEVSKTKSIQPTKTVSPAFTSSPVLTTLAPRLASSRDSIGDIKTGTHSEHPSLHTAIKPFDDEKFETRFVTKTEGTIVKTADDQEIIDENRSNAYSTISTHRFNSVDLYPTGLVSSIGGTIVMDDMTTLLTTFVYGTYIQGQYAQIVQSTSSIFYLVSKSASAGIQASQPVKFLTTTQSPDNPEFTTEFYDLYDYDYEGAVTEDLPFAVEDIVDNNIGRSVASSPGQQLIVDTNEKKDQELDITTPQPVEDYSLTTLTSYVTYFRDGQTTVQTSYTTSTVFMPFFGVQESSAEFASAEKSASSHIATSTYLTTYTYYTTLFADGVTRVSSNIQVSTKTIGASELRLNFSPTSSRAFSTTESLSSLDFHDSIIYDDNDFTTESLIESFTESISESTSESSTDSSGQDVTEQPGLSLDSSLNPDEEVNAVFLPRTYYTTFTYFTTYYRSETSTIVSSLETITNVVTDADEHEQHKLLTPVVPTYPVTYYTTYTYWTTFFKENETISTSTEKTLSNIVTPTAKTTPTVIHDSVITVQPTLTSPSVISSVPAVTTFYTTYTYYTSTYVGDSAIVNSRLETVTSVVSATPLSETTEDDFTIATSRPETISVISATPLSDAREDITEGTIKNKPCTSTSCTGLLSTIRGSTVIDGTTTIFSTNIIGTVIDGLYAQIQSTTSRVILPSSETPFFLFPATTSEPTTDSTPFFIFPATDEVSPSTATVETEDTTPPSNEDESVTSRLNLFITPTLASSFSDLSTDLFDVNAATEGLPEEVTTDQPEEDGGFLISSSKSKFPVKSVFPSSSQIRPFASRSRRPDIIAFLRRSSTRSRPATITRDGITPTVTATPASGSDESIISSSNKQFRFGFLSTSGVHSSSQRFRFNPSSEFSRSGSSGSSAIWPTSSTGFGFTSSSAKPFGGISSSGGFRFNSASSSFSSVRKSISPSSVLPQVTATEAPESDLVDEEESQNFNNPETSFRPFSFRQRPSSNGAGTRSAVPFALLNRRPSPSGSTRALPAVSRFAEAITQKPNTEDSPNERQQQATTTAKPKNDQKNNRINRLSPEERRQNRFRQSRPDLSKLFRRRNPFNKDLENEASDLEPVYIEADGRILSPEEVEAILAEEVLLEETLTRRKRQVTSEFGARTTSRGNTRFNRQNSDATPAPSLPKRGSRQANRQVEATPARSNPGSQFTLSNSRRGRAREEEAPAVTPQRSTSRNTLPLRPRASSTRAAVPLGNIRGRGFRRPSTDNNIRTSNRFTPSRPTSSPIKRPRPATTRNTSRRPTQTRNNQQTNPIANFRNRPAPDIPTEAPAIFPSNDGGFLIQDELTVTREIPVKATIPLVEDGKTVQKEVITASYQTEIVQPDQITQTDVNGEIKLLLSTVDGGTDITQYIIEPVETTSVTFTKTFIGGRRTSVEHILPTTAYNIVTVTKAKGGGDLQQLLQLLLGQQQQQNPLLAALGLGQQISSEVVHTKSFVTTVTNLLSTVIPVIFRGKTIETTVVDSDVKVITATELSTETILTQATVSPFNNPGSLNPLLPLLLQGQLQQQSPQLRPTREPSVDARTVDPQMLGQLLKQQQEKQEQMTEDKPQRMTGRQIPVPPRPEPTPPPVETSVVTLYVSGRRPGEFSTLLSTVTLGEDSTRIKRGSLHTKNVQATALPHYIETDKGLFQLPQSYDEDDMDWYIMSAMNEIDTNEISKVTPSLDSVIGDLIQHYDQRHTVIQNGTHSFKTQPFLWVGPAESAPLKRNVRSAQRGNGLESSHVLSRSPSARKIQDETPQQIISDEKERPVLGQFNVPGLRFQSRLISEQIQQLQPPTTYYTTFTYYTTLVDEIGQEFVQSSEETLTQIATNGNVRFDDFTRTGAGSPQISAVPIQTKFTLQDAIIPGKPRPVPDPVFPEPPPPFGPVIRHFDEAQPFQPVPQPFVPKEFRNREQQDLQINIPVGQSALTSDQGQLLGRKVTQNASPQSPQLLIQPARKESSLFSREEEHLALSQKPRRVVLTRKRPVQRNEDLKTDGPTENEDITEPELVQDIQKEKSLQQSGDIQKIVSAPNKELQDVEVDTVSNDGTRNRHRARVTTSRRPIQPTTTTDVLDTSTANSGGRRRVVVTRRLPQPTVVASRLHPLVATVNTYYTVYSYLYTLYEGSTPFSVSTREVTVSNEVDPTVVSVLPKFQTGTPVQGFYTLDMGSTTATLGERVLDSLTTQIFLASATLVELSPEAIRQNAENHRQSLDQTPETITRPSRRRPTTPASSLQSSLTEADPTESTDTPFLTTSSLRATQSRGRFTQPETTTEPFRAGVRNRGRGTVRFEDPLKRSRFTITRRRPVTPATQEPVPDPQVPSRDSLLPRAPVRSRGRVTPSDVSVTDEDHDTTESIRSQGKSELTDTKDHDTTESIRSQGKSELTDTKDHDTTESIRSQGKSELTDTKDVTTEATRHRERPSFDIPIDAFKRRERPGAPATPFSHSRFQSSHRESTSPSSADDDTTLPSVPEIHADEETTEQLPTESPLSEAHVPTPTPTRPTRPPRTSIRRDDIPIIRRPGSERTQKPRPFVTQEDLTIPSSGLELRFTPAPEEPTSPSSLPSEDLKDSHAFGDDDYYHDEYYDDYYYYGDDYSDALPVDGAQKDDVLSTDEGSNNESLSTPSKTGPKVVRPTQLSITSSSFDIIEALKRERTYTQIVAPSRSRENESRRRTRTQIESITQAPLPSDVVYSTYATTTLLPILGGEHSITLTILTSTLVTLAEDQVHLITASPELFNPALVTGTSSLLPSLSVPSLLLPSIASPEVVDTQAATVTTLTLPDGEVVTTTLPPQTSRAFGFFPDSESDHGSDLSSGRAVVGQPGSNQVGSLQSSQADPGDQRLGARFSVGARHNLATKVMSNGVEVIVAGDKTASPLPPEQVITNNFEKFRRPITLPPSTLSDQMLLFASLETDHPKVTQVPGLDDGNYQTNTYFTTYTFYNTLLAANKPFVITSKQTIENIVTVPLPDAGNFVERTQVTFDTQTYYTTQTFTRTVGEEVVTSQEVLTQVVITEAPSVQRTSVQPTLTSVVTKTYFTTLTYYNTALDGDSSVVSTDTVVSSEIVSETVYITGTATLTAGDLTLTPTPSLQPTTFSEGEDDLVLYATKTIYTTLTYLTTILEGSQTITASSIEVSSNIVTEPLVSALSSEELLSLKNSYLANQVTPTATSVPQPQTISYVHIRDNIYKQFRTFFATVTHYSTNAVGVINSSIETRTKVLTSTITTTSVPASLLITPIGVFSTPSIGATAIGSVPDSGSSIQLDPSYLSALKSSFLASQSTTGARPGEEEGLQATVLVEGDDDASGTFVVSDSTTSATLLVRPTDELSTSILSGQTVVILDSSHLSSLKSSFLASPTASPSVSPSPVISTSVLDSSTVLTGIDGETTTLGPGDPVVVVVPATAENETVLPEIPLTVRPAVFPIPPAGAIPAASSGGAAPAVSGGSAETGASGNVGGVSLTGNQENGLNIDLGPVFTAVAGILRNNLNNQLSNAKSDDNRRKVNTPLRPTNTVIAAQREPLLIPVGGVGASLSSSKDQTDDGERVFIPLRRPSITQAQPRFPSRATSVHESTPGFIRITPERPILEPSDLPLPIHVSEMQGFGPTFRPPSTQLGFTAMTEDALGPTRVSVISGSQTIFFGGVDLNDLPPPGLPATGAAVDRTTVVINPSQPVLTEETRPVPVPVRVPAHNDGGVLPDQEAAGDMHPQIILSRPSPKMPQPSRVGPQTIVSIEGDNRIVRTQIIHAQPVDEYRPEAAIIVSPARGEFVLQSTVGVGILSGGLNDDNRPRPPTGLEGTVLTGSETVLVGQGIDNGRTTVVRGSSTVLSGATTIFGSLFTRPAENNEPQGDITSVVSGPRGIPTRLITRLETSARTITATRTDVVFTAGQTSTLTQVIRSTLPLRTAITTIVGTSTKVNYVTATNSPNVSVTGNRFKDDDPTTYPPGSPFDPANYPSFPLDPRPVDDEDLRLPGDAEVVLNEASLGIAEDNEISRVVESQSPDQEIHVGGPLRAPISKCNPQCSASRQEVCRLIRGVHTCVCRSGYARRNTYDSCKPSLAYNIQLLLDGISERQLIFDPVLRNRSHPITQELADNTILGIDEALMASKLAPHYHSARVIKFTDTKEMAMPASAEPMERGVVAEIKVELAKPLDKDYEEDQDLLNEWDVRRALELSLRNTNYSLAGTELYANREAAVLASHDFDECSSEEHNDCSHNAHCFNTPGSYLCTCKDGFKDIADMPGRECAVQTEQCSFCNFQGECITKPDGNQGCRCLQWFSGDRCQLNLRVMLIVLVTVGSLLVLLLFLCLLLCCLRAKRNTASTLAQRTGAPTFLRARGTGMASTLDRRAMIHETSSESSGEHSRMHGTSFLAATHGEKPDHKSRPTRSEMTASRQSNASFSEDRSVGVHTTLPPVVSLIPRVKGPAPRRPSVVSRGENGEPRVMIGADARSDLANSQQAFVDLLEQQPAATLPPKQGRTSRRESLTAASIHGSNNRIHRSRSHSREGLNDTFVHHHHNIHQGSMRSRSSDRLHHHGSSHDFNMDFGVNFSFRDGERTMSEARSYDETTVRPPIRTMGPDSFYSSKALSSQHISDEHQTMAERDGCSTLVYPQTELYRPVRDTDSLSDMSDHNSKAASSRAASRSFFS